ncbi:MAG: hypothetical protein JSR21_14060 [Proteobacteria bacterium]|nr:hypothetical protein [Pseudomonadota bacterium]
MKKVRAPLPQDTPAHPGASLGDISDMFGMLKNEKGPRLSIEEIKQVTEEAWAWPERG